MATNKNTIRAIRGVFTNDDMVALAALLAKYGYAVKIARVDKPGTKGAKENVVEYWEER